MLRKIIKIDEERCNGCGACVETCHEGAIELVNGKAKLTKESYCDGLGNCLPVCPMDAISFEEREAPAFDESAVNKIKVQPKCPGKAASVIKRSLVTQQMRNKPQSMLMQWPCQIKLVPVNAPYFNKANLLIAADCTAYAYGNFHEEFIKGRITLVGCPKLDDVDYTEKLTQIISQNDINSITVVRMEVPCCSGIEIAAKKALKMSGKHIPWQVVTITTEGKILE